MKKAIILLSITFFTSCKSVLINYALKKSGIYDEKIHLKKINSPGKIVVFFPMIHAGTKPYYTDVKNKIDSLKRQNYFFYYEHVSADKKELTNLRKWKKLHGIPFSKKGYKSMIDSLLTNKLNIKLKKKIISQPSYTKLGLDSLNSKNVDATLIEVLTYYEKKYGKVKLEPCDFETTIYEETLCKNDDILKGNIKKDVMIDFRNNIVIKELLKEKHSKIAIIYGKEHIKTLKDELFKYDYK